MRLMNIGFCLVWAVAVACGSQDPTAKADGQCSCPAGAKGDVGPAGPMGLTGMSVKGDVGPKGDIGPVGPQGQIGQTGATGATGPTGQTGATGAQGVQGIQGVKGDPGGIVRSKIYTVQPNNQFSLAYQQLSQTQIDCKNVNDTAIAGGIIYIMATPNLAEHTCWPTNPNVPNQIMGWHCEVRSQTSPNLTFYPWVMCTTP